MLIAVLDSVGLCRWFRPKLYTQYTKVSEF